MGEPTPPDNTTGNIQVVPEVLRNFNVKVFSPFEQTLYGNSAVVNGVTMGWDREVKPLLKEYIKTRDPEIGKRLFTPVLLQEDASQHEFVLANRKKAQEARFMRGASLNLLDVQARLEMGDKGVEAYLLAPVEEWNKEEWEVGIMDSARNPTSDPEALALLKLDKEFADVLHIDIAEDGRRIVRINDAIQESV